MNMFGDRFCYLGNVDLSSWQKHSSSGNMAGKDLCVNRGKLESIPMLTSQDRPFRFTALILKAIGAVEHKGSGL